MIYSDTIYAAEFVPSVTSINPCASGFIGLSTTLLVIPLDPVAPQSIEYPHNQIDDQFMSQLEATEHTQRVLKFQLNVLEGDEHALLPPQPNYTSAKPFTFVNVPLMERLEDLQRGQAELQDQIVILGLRKAQDKVMSI